MRKFDITIKNKTTLEKKNFFEQYYTFAEAFRFAFLKCHNGMSREWEITSIKQTEIAQ